MIKNRFAANVETYLPLFLLLCLGAGDLTLQFAKFPQFGAAVWWVASFYLVWITLRQVSANLFRKASFFTTITVFGIIAALVMSFTNPRFSHFESTAEVRCMLDLFHKSVFNGFKETCHIGYPARQFFLPIVPSLLFGIKQWALNFGHSLYLFMGLLIFSSGALQVVKSSRVGDFAIASMLLLLFQVYYFLFLVLNFEQAMYPVSFALIISGLFLLLCNSHKERTLAEIGIVVYCCIFSYTPSLSLVGLAIIALLWIAVAIPRQRFLSLGIVVVILSGLAVSVFHRGDIILASPDAVGIKKNDHAVIVSRLIELPHVILRQWDRPEIQGYGPHLMSYGLAIFCALAIAVALFSLILFFKNSPRKFLIRDLILNPPAAFLVLIVFAWAVCVLIISILSHGYANPPPNFAIHRTTLAFPVIFATIIYFISDRIRQSTATIGVAFIIWCGATFGAVLYWQEWMRIRQPSIHFQMLTQIAATEPFGSDKRISIIINKKIEDYYFSMLDQGQYYFPSLEYRFEWDDCLKNMCNRLLPFPHNKLSEEKLSAAPDLIFAVSNSAFEKCIAPELWKEKRTAEIPDTYLVNVTSLCKSPD